MKSRPVVFLPALLAMALAGALPASPGFAPAAAEAPTKAAAWAPALDWVSRFRAAHGLEPLAPEPALERAAAAYAAVLAASGRLAHRDGEGRGVLARYRAAGGSAARVGEILGAGPDLAAVTAAWEASPAHAAAALDPRWTRAGAASAPQSAPQCAAPAAPGRGQVWVVLFAEQRVEGFGVVRQPGGGYLVTGAFRDPEAAEAVLLSGLAAVQPAAWDAARRGFRFFLPDAAGRRYHRLGYRNPCGQFILAGAFFPALASASTDAGRP